MTSDRSCLEPSEAVRRNRAEDFGLDLSGFSPQALDDLMSMAVAKSPLVAT